MNVLRRRIGVRLSLSFLTKWTYTEVTAPVPSFEYILKLLQPSASPDQRKKEKLKKFS